MPAVNVVLAAEAFTRTATTAHDAVSRIADDKWPEPKPKPNAAEGPEGSLQVDDAEYEDRTITLKLDTTNPDGEIGTRPWVQAWEQIAAAASRDRSATLTSTFSDGTTLKFDVLTAHFDADLGHEHWAGYGSGELTLVCRPFGRRPAVAVPGSVTTTAVGEMPLWHPNSPFKGDVPALLEVTAMWADRRRDAIAVMCDDQPFALAPTAVMSGWTSSSDPEALGSSVVSGQAPRTPSPVATWTSPVAGRCMIDVRLRSVSTNAVERVHLLVDGRRSASSTIVPAVAGESGVQRWRRALFAGVDLEHGSIVQLAAGSAAGPSFAIDIATFAVSPTADAQISPADGELTSGFVAGDDIPDTGPDTTLHGRTASFGGTWNAPDWDYGPSWGYAAVGSNAAKLSPSVSLGSLAGTAQHCSAEFTAYFQGDAEIGLFSTSGSRKVVITRDGVGDSLGVEINDGANTITRHLRVLPSGPPYGFSDSRVVDARVQIDADGRVLVYLALKGDRLELLAALHVPGLAGGTYRAAIEGTPVVDMARVYSLRFLYGDTLPYDRSVVWGRQPGPYLVSGAMPTARPGSSPYVLMRAAATASDSPASPHPISISVLATERYLQVPGG